LKQVNAPKLKPSLLQNITGKLPGNWPPHRNKNVYYFGYLARFGDMSFGGRSFGDMSFGGVSFGDISSGDLMV